MSDRWGLWFAVEGDLRFLSHRDCARAMERLAARAALPLRFSQGFNPHPALALICPRPVGVASRDDLAVIALVEPMAPDSILRAVNAEAPPGMRFLRACRLAGGRAPRARAARYEWPVPPDRRAGLEARLRQFRAAESAPVRRRRSAGPGRQDGPAVTIDLKPLAPEIALEGDRLRWVLAPVKDTWARPGEVLEALGLDAQADLAGVVRTAVDYEFEPAPSPPDGPSKASG